MTTCRMSVVAQAQHDMRTTTLLSQHLTPFLLPCHCSGAPSACWYTLVICTSDLRGAGTTSEVFVTLAGSKGTSPRVKLPSQVRACMFTCRHGCLLPCMNS